LPVGPILLHSSNSISSFTESKRKCFATLRAHDPFVNDIQYTIHSKRRDLSGLQVERFGVAMFCRSR
jgi:hypothetical protein